MVPAAGSAPSEYSAGFLNEDRTKELLSGQRIQNSSETAHERKTKEHKAVQRQQLEKRKLRRCKPVKVKVAAYMYTKENSG